MRSLLLALGLAACGGSPARTTLPLATRGDLVGEGEGADVPLAHAAALADLAAQIRSRVVSLTSRTAMAYGRGDEVRSSVSIVQSIEVGAAFDDSGLARRLSVDRGPWGVRVRLGLDRSRYAARLRIGRIPHEATIRGALEEDRASPVAEWDALRRAAAAARQALAIELEASAVDGRWTELDDLAALLADLETRRASAASRLAVEVVIENEPRITAGIQAACARVFTSPVGEAKLAVRGVVRRRTFLDHDLAFAETEARLDVWGGARLLERIVIPGSATRAGDRTAARAIERSDLALELLVSRALEESIAPRLGRGRPGQPDVVMSATFDGRCRARPEEPAQRLSAARREG